EESGAGTPARNSRPSRDHPEEAIGRDQREPRALLAGQALSADPETPCSWAGRARTRSGKRRLRRSQKSAAPTAYAEIYRPAGGSIRWEDAAGNRCGSPLGWPTSGTAEGPGEPGATHPAADRVPVAGSDPRCSIPSPALHSPWQPAHLVPRRV